MTANLAAEPEDFAAVFTGVTFPAAVLPATDFLAGGAAVFFAGSAAVFFAGFAMGSFAAGAAAGFFPAGAAAGLAFLRTRAAGAAAFPFADCSRPEVALAMGSSLLYVSVEHSIDRMCRAFQEGVTKLIADGLPTLISTPVRIRLPDDWSM
ncbi:MAG: hypothetical protein ACJ8AI_14240 [Rhodopila sp.]